jgi:protein-tyrosine phosphatase
MRKGVRWICESSLFVHNLPAEPGASLGKALGIPAVPNFRDLGGYKTGEGAPVARGLVYRSDNFNPMNAEDIKNLERLGLKNNYDLRTTSEANLKPDQMPPGVQYHLLNVLAGDKLTGPTELQELMHEPKKANALLGDGKIDVLYIDHYREFVSLESAQKSYSELFRSLADSQKLPAVFHCTTGKDRTGWAAAALLTLLGVPRETVMADFMRSNENTLPRHQAAIDGFVAGGGDRAIPVAMFGVKSEHLEASFDELQKRYGTIENYFAEGLSIDAAGQKTLRQLYLDRK